MRSTHARSAADENGAKIQTLLTDGAGHADLYRTITTGPSGQRRDLLVGRIRFREFGPDEFAIIDEIGETAGYARRSFGNGWSITRVDYDGGLQWIGYAAESLALGVDVLMNGEHAATGRHDSRRISPGRWIPNKYLTN